jgi:hypothetical protein
MNAIERTTHYYVTLQPGENLLQAHHRGRESAPADYRGAIFIR